MPTAKKGTPKKPSATAKASSASPKKAGVKPASVASSSRKVSKKTAALDPKVRADMSPEVREVEIVEPEIEDSIRHEIPLDPDDASFAVGGIGPLDPGIEEGHIHEIAAGSEKTDQLQRIPFPAIARLSNLPATQDPLTQYLAEIRHYPLLTPEEERKLAVDFREKNDRVAAEKLVTSNLRFVVKIAAEYSKFGARMIDLVQEGNVGLMQAVKEFNPYRGTRLITYAVWWIRGYIREYLMRQYSMVRVGTTHNQKKLFYNLQQEEQRLESLGENHDTHALSESLGVPEHDVETMKMRMGRRDVSLDSPLDDESRSSLMDRQTSGVEDSPEEQVSRSQELAALHTQIEKVRPDLNSKELYILENRLLSDEPMTLQEIGDKVGITRERTRQIEARVLDKIRKLLEASAGHLPNHSQEK